MMRLARHLTGDNDPDCARVLKRLAKAKEKKKRAEDREHDVKKDIKDAKQQLRDLQAARAEEGKSRLGLAAGARGCAGTVDGRP